jgi:hypothetical protein
MASGFPVHNGLSVLLQAPRVTRCSRSHSRDATPSLGHVFGDEVTSFLVSLPLAVCDVALGARGGELTQ